MKKFFAILIISLYLCVSVFAQNLALKVLEKPKPELPKDFGTLDVQGTIRLKVEFLFDGQIGKVIVISKLTNDLTDLAVDAAKRIKFEPEIKDGNPVTVNKVVSYIYSFDGGWKVSPRKTTNQKNSKLAN